MNFFRAWSNYRRYCKAAGLTNQEMATIQQFAEIFKENKINNHKECNYV